MSKLSPATQRSGQTGGVGVAGAASDTVVSATATATAAEWKEKHTMDNLYLYWRIFSTTTGIEILTTSTRSNPLVESAIGWFGFYF
jgi:hypothetical protein